MGELLFASLLFALMHIGWHSVLDVGYVFLVGVFLAAAVHRTGSILGTSLAHGLANTMLFHHPAAPVTRRWQHLDLLASVTLTLLTALLA